MSNLKPDIPEVPEKNGGEFLSRVARASAIQEHKVDVRVWRHFSSSKPTKGDEAHGL